MIGSTHLISQTGWNRCESSLSLSYKLLRAVVNTRMSHFWNICNRVAAYEYNTGLQAGYNDVKHVRGSPRVPGVLAWEVPHVPDSLHVPGPLHPCGQCTCLGAAISIAVA